jgi:hypothetical protein
MLGRLLGRAHPYLDGNGDAEPVLAAFPLPPSPCRPRLACLVLVSPVHLRVRAVGIQSAALSAGHPMPMCNGCLPVAVRRTARQPWRASREPPTAIMA